MDLIYFTKNKISNLNDLARWQIPYIDVTILISGKMYYTINDEAVELYPGDVIVFQPQDYRFRKGGGKCEYYSINVLLDENDSLPIFRGVIRRFLTDEILNLLKIIEQSRNKPSLMSETKCLLLFEFLYYSLYESVVSDQRNDCIVTIKKYVDENLDRKISIKEISDQVFLTPNYCNYLFKKCTGQTLNKYITEQKILHAKYLLISTEISLTDLAADLGYDYSYFSKQFKKVTGMTPVNFRRKRIYGT